ncbi:acireductone synthase [Micromonospora sp. B11E3]|uniref:acireductone synthase n=1 Tax=Micromonospora sp. B11E3 TaxID=3153562 RepID=UPI00325EB9C3
MSSDVVSGEPVWIILDVEGTVVPTEYVHATLFDHARAGLAGWITRNLDTPAGRDALAAVRRAAGLADSAGPDEIMTVLLAWIDQDRKEPALKVLQGHVWQEGYASGELRTPLFPDVIRALRRWRAAGHRLGIFSSGSVAAQRAVLSRTDAGDLRDHFAVHFDPLGVGAKREPDAYRAMRARLTPAGRAGDGGADGAPPPVFLSDVPAELDAAVAAGWRAVGVARPGEPYGNADFGPHQVVRGFDDIDGVRR